VTTAIKKRNPISQCEQTARLSEFFRTHKVCLKLKTPSLIETGFYSGMGNNIISFGKITCKFTAQKSETKTSTISSLKYSQERCSILFCRTIYLED
jgi:hypothetical protein